MMKKPVKIMLASLGLAVMVSAVAIACGDSFPWQLLDSRKETFSTMIPVDNFYKQVKMLIVVDPKERRNLLSATTLSSDAYYGPSETTPSKTCQQTDASYQQAAALFKNQQWEQAYTAFTPLAENGPLAQQVCAMYSLGRIAVKLNKIDDAIRAFRITSALVAAQGAPDPLHLGISSYGDAAGLILDQIGTRTTSNANQPGFIVWKVGPVQPDSLIQLRTALQLYARQSALGETGGEDSVLVVLRGLTDIHNDNAKILLEQAVVDPFIQKILLAYAFAVDVNEYDATTKNVLQVFAKAADDNKDVGDLASLAGLAYLNNDMVHAKKFAEYDWGKNENAVDAWILAKLALQENQRDKAQNYYHQAISHLNDDTVLPNVKNRIQGEQAVLMLSRGDFVQALEQLWPERKVYWGDIVYLSEDVLTVDELRQFVDRHTVETVKANPTDDSACNEFTLSRDGCSLSFRRLVARRLVRVGMLKEARPYFTDPKDRHLVDEYMTLMDEMHHSWWAVNRAQAAWKAAQIMRFHGMELSGTDGYPDQNPGYSSVGTGQVMAAVTKPENAPWSVPQEQDRIKAAWAQPNHRFHYRYIAVDHVLYATSFVPHQSQAYAAMLCHANGWMQNTAYYMGSVLDPATANPNLVGMNIDPTYATMKGKELYKMYVDNGPLVPFGKNFGHHCPDPDFANIPAVKNKIFWRKVRASLHFLKFY